MHIDIYEFVDGDETCEDAEYLGYVSLEEDDVYIDVDDVKLAEKLENLFADPIVYADSTTGSEKEAEPYTEEFFRQVLPMLQEMNTRGLLKDEETERYVSAAPVDPEELENEEEEELPVGMEMTDIRTLDEEYRLEEESDEIEPDEDEEEPEEMERMGRDDYEDDEYMQ
jgi:hypothetical protein